MRKYCIALAVALLTINSAFAQTPDSAFAVSKSGVSLFRVNVNGGALFGGSYDAGASNGVPAEGAGTRMMWYPGKGAFRAGGINGTQWDDANIGTYSTALGENVRASGDNSLAAGNRATAANVGTIALGEDVTATGANSVVFGYKASTSSAAGSPRVGTFVFGDRSTTTDTIHPLYTNSATWRVANGFLVWTTSNQTTGVMITSGATQNPWAQTNAAIATSTGAYLHTNGTWTNNSDVNRKHAFDGISGEAVLENLSTLPISSWSYRTEAPGIRHIGPMAQDFHAVFRLGDDPKAISSVDEAGVALAAAQALERRTAELRRQNAALRDEVTELKKRLERLEARLRE